MRVPSYKLEENAKMKQLFQGGSKKIHHHKDVSLTTNFSLLYYLFIGMRELFTTIILYSLQEIGR